MKALVTGGAGFIGSTLVDRLLEEGNEVTVIDNLTSGKLDNLDQATTKHGERLTFHELDIRNASAVDAVVDARPDIVFHLAAQMDVRVSVADPVYDASVNLIGSLNMLEGARQGGTSKFVFASSGGTIYGEAADELLPIDETVPQNPLSPYGISKKAMGDYLRAYRELHGLEFACLALGNIFGPRQDPHGEAGVVSIFGQRLLAGDPCTIFGDGSATRDYVFVDDTVDAFVRAASMGTGLFNIGTGVETSTRDLYFAMAKAAGVEVEPVYAPARAGELQRSVLDNGKAKRELGWQPRMNVADGVKFVLDFIRSRS